MSVLNALEQTGKLLLEHADVLVDVVQAIERGTPKDAIRAAIRAAKVQVSDAAMREELGVDKG
jgi:hypothetical protein